MISGTSTEQVEAGRGTGPESGHTVRGLNVKAIASEGALCFVSEIYRGKACGSVKLIPV